MRKELANLTRMQTKEWTRRENLKAREILRRLRWLKAHLPMELQVMRRRSGVEEDVVVDADGGRKLWARR